MSRSRTRSRRRAALGPVLALMLASGTACSGLVQRPAVRIADVRVVGVGFSGATAEIDVSVVNPNGFALTSKDLQYHLAFQEEPGGEGDASWVTIAEGRSGETVRVPADDSARVTLAVPFRYSDVGRAASSFLRTGELRYRLTGEVLFDAPVRDIRIPFDDTGEVGL